MTSFHGGAWIRLSCCHVLKCLTQITVFPEHHIEVLRFGCPDINEITGSFGLAARKNEVRKEKRLLRGENPIYRCGRDIQ